jgi:hypothetical protein
MLFNKSLKNYMHWKLRNWITNRKNNSYRSVLIEICYSSTFTVKIGSSAAWILGISTGSCKVKLQNVDWPKYCAEIEWFPRKGLNRQAVAQKKRSQ